MPYDPIMILEQAAWELEGPHVPSGLWPLNGPDKAAEVCWSAAQYLRDPSYFGPTHAYSAVAAIAEVA